jgi:hypothetical protein
VKGNHHVLILAARDLERTSHFLEEVGLYPTIALVTVGVFVLAYVIRGAENYVRHLHGKSYLAFASPRFILTVIGCALVANGFIVWSVFVDRLPAHAAPVTTSAGLLCLIASLAWSIALHVRRIRRIPGTSAKK